MFPRQKWGMLGKKNEDWFWLENKNNKTKDLLMEVTLKELQKMLIDGKISTVQFTQIMNENFGEQTVMKSMQDTMKEVYGKDILTRPIPENLKKMTGE